MIIHTMKQYSEEYWETRIGKMTASNLKKCVSSTGKKSSSWKEYAFKVAAEIVRNKPELSFQSEAMKDGLEFEPEARQSFEFISGIEINEVGLVEREDLPGVSCSPDGISDDRKIGLEIKVRTPGVQMKTLYEKKIPSADKPQVFSSLWICDELERYAYFSYNPDMKPCTIYIDRDNEEYQAYATALENYLPDMLEFIQKVVKES